MGILPRLPIIIFLSLVTTHAMGQGSAAGYGYGGNRGGGGGGFGGGGNAGAGTSFEDQDTGRNDKSRPEFEKQFWQTRTNLILTHGDRVEIKLKLEAGETIFAVASSEAFDPALEVADSSGKKLAENDDREEGDQQPFLAYRSEKGGSFSLLVKSFRSAAGGKFTVSFRRLKAVDAVFGPKKIERTTSGLNRLSFRFSGKKGKAYDVGYRHFGAGSDTFGSPIDVERIVGPTGVEHNDFELVPDGQGTVFIAKRDGDFYIETINYQGDDFRTNFKEFEVTQISSEEAHRSI